MLGVTNSQVYLHNYKMHKNLFLKALSFMAQELYLIK